ncbi:MAG: hypothetical protein HY928_02000 [Elusimicrobia bacterium]|nr:hypothetical protein [Elusimicrobiota bacterium]
MSELLTVYLWVLLLTSLSAAVFLASRVSGADLKVRLAAYFALYNIACVLLRFVMPTREMAMALNWMNPLLGLTFNIILPFDRAMAIADPAARIAVRATATLFGSTTAWFGLGWVTGAMLDDRLRG